MLRGAADEVLAAIKTEGVLDSERKKDVEEVLGSIPDEYFAELFRRKPFKRSFRRCLDI